MRLRSFSRRSCSSTSPQSPLIWHTRPLSQKASLVSLDSLSSDDKDRSDRSLGNDSNQLHLPVRKFAKRRAASSSALRESSPSDLRFMGAAPYFRQRPRLRLFILAFVGTFTR